MELQVIDHPLVSHKLSVLRDKNTPSPVFRQLVEELIMLLSYESTRGIAVEDIEIDTPVAHTVGKALAKPRPIVVPILRAGLGMLEGMTRLIPSAEVGFLGLKRDDSTLEAITYATRLPADLTNRQCYVLDPMLATGHTLIASIDYLLERGARDVTAICILAAPEGLQALEQHLADRANVKIVVAAVDEGLNERSYIVPGLGDAGDRLFGVVD